MPFSHCLLVPGNKPTTSTDMKVIDYFQSFENYFWQWEENGEVLAMQGGGTIIYTDDLVPLLAGMAESGLPHFGAILLAIIALNKSAEDPLGYIRSQFESNTVYDKAVPSDSFTDSFAFLQELQNLPKEFKTGQRRQVLLSAIFTAAHNRVNVSTSRGIVDYLKDGAGRSRIQKQKPFLLRILFRELQVLELLHRRYPTVQSILDALVDLPDLDDYDPLLLESPSTSETNYEDFVEELTANPLAFQVGALIRPIWAGLKIPIFNALPSQQPLGGFSDLTNKGEFDKLLVSEFANDELVFLSRLANQEALYLLREMPPVADNLQRIILIDISLKTWGISKIIAHAVALAISRHPKAKGAAEQFVVGHHFSPMGNMDTGAIVDGLQKVSVALNPSQGISEFLKANDQHKNLEIFYITVEEGLKNAAINKILTENSLIFKYVITTNTRGEVHFYSHKNRALNMLQSMQLALTRLWSTAKKQVGSTTPAPIEASTSLLPILLPVPFDISRMFSSEYSDYLVSNRALFQQEKELDGQSKWQSKKGVDLILQNVPINGSYELGTTDDGQVLFLSYHQSRILRITNLSSQVSVEASFTDWKAKRYREFLFVDGRFMYLLHAPHAIVFNADFRRKVLEFEKIEVDHDIFQQIYLDRQKELGHRRYGTFGGNMLKKVRSVAINTSNQLIISDFVLQLSESAAVTFSKGQSSFQRKLIAKEGPTKNAHVFHDGSKVSIHAHGYLTLESSNTDIPVIYLTANFTENIGMATNAHFAGNAFYLKTPFCRFSLTSCGDKKLEVIKLLKVHTGFGLQLCKEIADRAPTYFGLYIQPDKEEVMLEALRAIGCEIAQIGSRTIQQSIIPSKVFYENYIENFVQQILLTA